MAVTAKYSLAAVQLDTTVDVMIRGITTQALSIESAVDQEPTSGEIYNRWLALTAQSFNGRFATFHVGTAFSAIGLGGLSISSLVTGLSLWLQQHALGGSRAGTLSHRKYNITRGIVFPRTLTCSHGQNQHASISYEIVPVYDGAVSPFTITPDLTMPAAEVNDVPGERFALGSMTIGGKLLSHIRQFEIDYGIKVVAESADGNPWPTFVSIETITPRITLRGIDPGWLADAVVPLTGLACTHANTIMYLRKRLSGDSFVPDGTAEHIKFTAAGLAHVQQAFDASGAGAAETSLVIPLRFDGTYAPVTFALSAIT